MSFWHGCCVSTLYSIAWVSSLAWVGVAPLAILCVISKTLKWRKFFNTTAIALQLETDSVLSLNAHPACYTRCWRCCWMTCNVPSRSLQPRTSLPYSASPTTFTAGLRSLQFNRRSELCNESLILLHSFTIQLSALILQLSGCWRLGP